jgi:hypothetical protein
MSSKRPFSLRLVVSDNVTFRAVWKEQLSDWSWFRSHALLHTSRQISTDILSASCFGDFWGRATVRAREVSLSLITNYVTAFAQLFTEPDWKGTEVLVIALRTLTVSSRVRILLRLMGSGSATTLPWKVKVIQRGVGKGSPPPNWITD